MQFALDRRIAPAGAQAQNHGLMKTTHDLFAT